MGRQDIPVGLRGALVHFDEVVEKFRRGLGRRDEEARRERSIELWAYWRM